MMPVTASTSFIFLDLCIYGYIYIYTCSLARSIGVIGVHPNSEISPNASLQHKWSLPSNLPKKNVVASTHLKKYASLVFPISPVFRVQMTRTYLNNHHVNKERSVVSFQMCILGLCIYYPGVIKLPIGGLKQCKHMVILNDLPFKNALFVLVINDPCNIYR